MSTYLGRLVDRAVGPPASAVTPRLAPVFPLGGAPEPQPEPLSAESTPDALGRAMTPRPRLPPMTLLERSVRPRRRAGR